MHLDQALSEGRYRAIASASIDGTAGAWGNGDMLCVRLDSSGELVLAAADDCDGVVHTVEGRQESTDGTTYKKIIGGKKYTVFTDAEFVEGELGSSPALSAGDKIYAQASGDVSNSATPGAGSIFVGYVLKGGSRVVIKVNRKQPATA